MKKIILFSGGFDSTLLALYSLEQNHDVVLVHYTFGHPAALAEISAVKKIHNHLKQKYNQKIKLHIFSAPIQSSINIGFGKSGARVIPNRNAVFLNLAINFANQARVSVIEYGAVLDDCSDYVDCRPDFVDKMNLIAKDWGVHISCPFIEMKKKDILKIITDDSALQFVSSCYEPKRVDKDWQQCGSCNSCISNQETVNEAQSQ